MSNISFKLPGSETVTLTGQTIDKLIRAGDGDAALLYLYILKTNGQKTSSQAAIALDKSKGWVASAMAVLSRLGLVQLDDEDSDLSGKASEPRREPSGSSAGSSPEEPRQYTESEVKHEILTGSDFAVVVDYTQGRLGKILSPDELMRLYGIYDNLRLPSEVILQLITHCIKESSKTGDGRTPSVRYIEKAAYTWEREGLFTLEKAEEYLKALEARKTEQGEVKNALGIRGREFSATEKKYVDSWIDMGFETGAIAIAYDRAVIKTGGLSLPYMDGILKNWHNKGLHTAEQIRDKDSGKRQDKTGPAKNNGLQKHGDPNREEIERMQRLLDKTKDE